MILLASSTRKGFDMRYQTIEYYVFSSGVLKALRSSSSVEFFQRDQTQVSLMVSFTGSSVRFRNRSFGTDMWSVGCVFAELLTLEPVFPGDNDIDQISRIFQCLGTPDEKTWPDFVKLPDASKIEFSSTSLDVKASWTLIRFPDTSCEARSLLEKILRLDPKQRLDSRSHVGSVFHDPYPHATTTSKALGQ